MLTFKQQQVVLKPILERETNKHCADCGSNTPTWASLDFGVFVCSNCSGAHRALGPTITRIKSTKLDQWNREWVDNMRIGNLEVNHYWEADGKSAAIKKPRSGASLDEHNRFVYDKYVRRKFVTDKNATEPLKAYKNGKYVSPAPNNIVNKNSIVGNLGEDDTSTVQFSKKQSQNVHVKKKSFNLLDEDNLVTFHSAQEKQSNGHGSSYQHHHQVPHQEEQDQFTDYVEAGHSHNHNAHIQQKKDPSKLSFDELLKNPVQTQTHQQPQHPQNVQQQPHQLHQNQWGMFGQQNAQNFGYMNHAYTQQQYVNQFAHNPYIGYAPHNGLHASYNYTNYNGYS